MAQKLGRTAAIPAFAQAASIFPIAACGTWRAADTLFIDRFVSIMPGSIDSMKRSPLTLTGG